MIYGYCRISRKTQNIERQIRNIKEAFPDAKIITEVYTGANIEHRARLLELLDTLEEGDTLVVDEVSRLSRDSNEGMVIYKKLFKNNINFISLKEPSVNTKNIKTMISSNISNEKVVCGDKLIGNMLSTFQENYNNLAFELAMDYVKTYFDFAQAEREKIRQRTKDGIKVAKANGKRIGTPKGTKLTTKKSIKAKKIIYHQSKDFEGSLRDADVIQLSGISRNTYYKYKRELRDEINKLDNQNWEEFLKTFG